MLKSFIDILYFFLDDSSSAPLESPKFAWHHHQTLDTYTIFDLSVSYMCNLALSQNPVAAKQQIPLAQNPVAQNPVVKIPSSKSR